MKKLIVLFVAIFALAFASQAQSFNKDYLLLYADTNTLTGSDVLVRHIYGHLPTLNPSNETVTFDYSRAYYLNGDLLQFLEQSQTAGYTETITIGQTTYTFLDLYEIIVDVNDNQWQTGAWQVFLQFVN